jgi:intein-encoded DNA endonuclease-like protein
MHEVDDWQMLSQGSLETRQKRSEYPEWITLAVADRFAIYDDVLKLPKSGSVAALRRYVQNRYRIRISYYTIHKWVNGVHNPKNRFNIPALNASSLCYVIGAILSDGHCYANPRKQSDRSIILFVKDYDFAMAFATAISRSFGKQGHYAFAINQGRYFVKVNSVMLCDLIAGGIESVRAVIENSPGTFIRGFFDGDGGVTATVSKGKLDVCLRATNSDQSLLLYILDLLQRYFGIHSSVGLATTGPRVEVIGKRRVQFILPTFELRIHHLSHVEKFGKEIGFAIGRKQQKLVDATRLIQQYGSRVAKEKWLQFYVKKNGRWIRKNSAPHGL